MGFQLIFVTCSTSHSLLNSNVIETQNLIDLSDDTNYQDSNTTIDTQKSNKKCSSIPATNDIEISKYDHSILTKSNITIYNEEKTNGQLIEVRKVQHEDYLKRKSLGDYDDE